jgi:phage terminase small subunit
MLKWLLRKQMRKPTLKQQRFILAFIKNGGNATQAALAAYDTTYATARVIGCENLTKPTIRREIDRLMKAVQLSTKDCLRAIKDALEAVDKDDHPDWDARLKAADMGLTVQGGSSLKGTLLSIGPQYGRR